MANPVDTPIPTNLLVSTKEGTTPGVNDVNPTSFTLDARNSTTTAIGAPEKTGATDTNDTIDGSTSMSADSTADATELFITTQIDVSENNDDKTNTLIAAIAGGVGGLLLLTLVGVAIACVLRRRGGGKKDDASTQLRTVGESIESSRTHNYAAFPASNDRVGDYDAPNSPL